MIGKIAGRLLEKHPPQIVGDVHGVGYELYVPMSTFYHLPATGADVALYTHFVVREQLYERLYRRALRSARLEIDTDGDGQANLRRPLNVMDLLRV